ncbi:MAG TPA: phage baseplate assembly protein V [Chloroflexia bacterium]|nr:phage baseplate assembly protein V [Chloroflexia bacterium]
MSQVRSIPAVRIEADGAPLPASQVLGLGSVRVQQELSAPTVCELTFHSPPGPPQGAVDLTPGTSLRLSVEGSTTTLFAGEVTAVEYIYGPAGQREVRVRAYDLLHRLRKRQTVRVHVQVSLQDLARELAADAGLQVAGDETGPLWRTLYQHRQSDLGVLVETAERCGLYLAVRNGTLHIFTLDGLGETVELALGTTLMEARVEINGDLACRTMSASGWDAQSVEAHDGQATAARLGRQVRAEAPPDKVGGSGTRYMVGEAFQDDRHAEALAQSELDWRAAREVTLWGIAEGDPRLQPGTPVEVTGIATDVAGRYVLSSVLHTVDDKLGFVSEISTTPPVPRARPEGSSVAFGVVTQVGDPDGLGRVKVSLPTYGEVETDWMGVVCVAAGQEKGLVALPDVGDKVLVIFSHEDPSQGVVLGGLYGKTAPPDPGVEDGAVKRYILRTPGGSYVQFDDGRNTVRLQDQQGSYLEFSPDTVLLHAETALEIEAPGKPITIRGQTVNFERA